MRRRRQEPPASGTGLRAASRLPRFPVERAALDSDDGLCSGAPALLALYYLILGVLAFSAAPLLLVVRLCCAPGHARGPVRPPDPGGVARGDGAAPTLQRDVRGVPARSRPSAGSTTRATGWRSRSSTTRPTRPRRIVAALVAEQRGAGLRHPPPPPHRPHRLQGRGAGRRAGRGARHAARGLRRRLRAAARTSCERPSPLRRPRSSAWSRGAGRTSTAATRC